jgi:hypothetical protein
VVNQYEFCWRCTLKAHPPTVNRNALTLIDTLANGCGPVVDRHAPGPNPAFDIPTGRNSRCGQYFL